MSEVTTARYLASALVMPLAVPQVLLLLTHWRYSRRTMARLFLAVELGMAVFTWLCWAVLGPTLLTTWLVGTLPAVLCAVLFLHCCELRSDRLAFLLVTIGVDTAICDTLTSMLTSRDTLAWCACKIVLSMVQLALLLRLCRRPLLEMLESNQMQWGQMTVLPLALWAAIMGYYTVPVTILRQRVPALPTLILCLVVVLTYVTLYRFQRATQAYTEARQYGELLRREVDALQRQAVQREAADEHMRVLRHDVRHYVLLFRAALDRAEPEVARELSERLEGEAAPPPRGAQTGCTVMDLVIDQAHELAERAGVTLRAELKLFDGLHVDMTELAVAVSNALENAVQAAARQPAGASRWVSVRSEICRQQLLVVISNPVSGPVRLDRRTGLPRAGQPGHGYGTLSMSMFARKYGCVLDCSVQEGVFSLRLLI